MKVICTRCGGTNIACEAIVNPNTGKIIDYLDESFMHANCGDCKEEVVITDVDRVKKDIDSMFFEFVKKNGEEPEYVECQIVWKDSQAKKEALIFEKRRKEKEDRKKKFEEQIEMWKSGKILELYLHYYLEDDQPNVWLRIKNGIIETSKNIKIERAEAERLWKLIKLFHNGSKFQRDMVLDTTGHKWKINSYKNDILVAGCHRIAYSEMKGIARQLGWD